MTKLIKLLNLARASFYYKTKLNSKDQLLKEQILSVLSFNPSYGHRRIAIALGLGRKKVRRVMRRYGLKPYKRKARWRKKRDLGRKPAKFMNLIKSSCPLKPNLVYVSDFTYIKYHFKYLYLATLMDLFSREIVGWNISGRHNKDLVLNTVLDAIKNQDFKLPKIIHSDQGSEYNCKNYINFLNYLGIQISMSKKKSPWENSHQESFYNNFKTDLGLEFGRFNNLGELIEAIHKTINYYNQERIHTFLKMPPVKFKQKYLEKVV